MNHQTHKLVIFVALLSGFVASTTQVAIVKPATEAGGGRIPAIHNANRRSDQPPKLSDTLTVAKSPFEPITLAPNSPAARNDERPMLVENPPRVSEISPPLSGNDEKRTTRATQASDEQRSSASTRGLDETSGIGDSGGGGLTDSGDSGSLASSSITASVATESPEESTNATEASTETATETDQITKLNESETTATTTSTTAAPISIETLSKVETISTTKSPLLTSSEESTSSVITTTTTTEQPVTSTASVASTPEPTTTVVTTEASTTTAQPPPTTTTTAVEITTKEETNLKETSNEPDASVTTTTTTTSPESANTAEDNQPTSRPDVAVPELVFTTTVAPVGVEHERPLATVAPTSSSTTSEAASSTIATIEILPITTTTTSTPPAPPLPTTTTTTAPAATQVSGVSEQSNCNHLPSYDSDEVQKVFREETTYKNRTIRGRFTYINFDQRYRLVHYTRLPYGPVKIDRVEELGRPKQDAVTDGNNEPAPGSILNEVPNAVLQLRNLLPNSLFGFPFLGPNSAGNHMGIGPRVDNANEDDKNSMYFYSTDSISTPNLLTPRVPVSLLPGQRMKPDQANVGASPIAESRGQDHLNGPSSSGKPLAFGMPNQQDDYSKQLNKLGADEPALSNLNQFQYASPFSSHSTDGKGIVYSYFSQQAAPAQYQYAPMPPVYQPLQYRPLHQSMNDGSPVVANQDHQHYNHQHQHQHHYHHHHQPHGHEHYMAPFMLAQQQSPQHDTNNDPSRLRLKVKSSKALNVNQEGTKSAQLRSRSSSGHYSLSSPVRQQQHARRSGKQNQQLLKPTPSVKHSPVVYHVLRNPAGHVYTSHYNQGYAMAYDDHQD